MTSTEQDRFELHARLRAVLGVKEADILMDHLPGHDWSDLVRTADLDRTATGIRGEMAEMRHDLTTEMADFRTELKTEMADLRTELKTEMADLRTELKTEMADLRTELKTELGKQTWRYIGTTVTMHAATIAMVGYLVTSTR